MSLEICLYLMVFILFLSILASGMIWGAVLAGVPNLYIMLASAIIFAIGAGIFKILSCRRNQACAVD